MNTIPTKTENPKGLHKKYFIAKLPEGIDGLVPVDINAEYFVLRLDTNAKDLEHVKACRIAIHAYADAIYPYLPELAFDLKTKYPLL